MIDLEQKYIEFIKETVSSMLHNYKLYIFGSRVKNRAKKYSDIDLAIDFQELTPQTKSKLEATFDNSTLPYEIDIIDLNSIDDKFKNLIKDELVLL